MTDHIVSKDWPDTITFHRLHALARRGYRAALGFDCEDTGFSMIELSHPKTRGALIPPPLTLWSNGIVATNQLLWPSYHVRQEHGEEPAWQKIIDVTDDEMFQSFVNHVPKPTVLDLYVFPCAILARKLIVHLLFAGSLCFCIAAAVMLLERVIAVG